MARPTSYSEEPLSGLVWTDLRGTTTRIQDKQCRKPFGRSKRPSMSVPSLALEPLSLAKVPSASAHSDDSPHSTRSSPPFTREPAGRTTDTHTALGRLCSDCPPSLCRLEPPQPPAQRPRLVQSEPLRLSRRRSVSTGKPQTPVRRDETRRPCSVLLRQSIHGGIRLQCQLKATTRALSSPPKRRYLTGAPRRPGEMISVCSVCETGSLMITSPGGMTSSVP